MLRFHSSSGVSSIGAAEAMPGVRDQDVEAAELAQRRRRTTRAPRPRRSRRSANARTRSLPCSAWSALQGVLERRGSMSGQHTQAPSASRRSRHGRADAARAAGDERDPALRGSSASACAGASPPRAASTRCRRPPARASAHVARHALGPAHHVDRVARRTRRRCARWPCPCAKVIMPDAGHQHDHRVRVAHRRASSACLQRS